MAPYHIRYYRDGNPDRGMSVGQIVLESLRQFQDSTHPAQIDGPHGTSMSYRELLVQTVQAAEGWKSMGLKKGDVVALISRNNHEVFPLTLSAVCRGLVLSFPAPYGTLDELRHALSISPAKVVVSEVRRLKHAMEAAPDAKHIVLDGEVPEDLDGVVETYQDLLQRGQLATPPPDPDTYQAVDVQDRTEHVNFVLFSSGTTGLPKGVMLRDSLMSLLLYNTSYMLGGSIDARVSLVTSQLCWISGVWELINGVVSGRTRVFVGVSDNLTLMSAIDKYKVQTWLSAPAVLITFLAEYHNRYSDRYNLGSLTTVLTGGSTIGAELQASLERDVGCSVTQVYGATEAGFVFGSEGNDSAPLGSMGKLIPWVEFRLVNPDTGEDIPVDVRNTVGEARVRSPYLMHSYANNPEETAKAFDELGFYKTGDLMYEDDNGYFFFVDRIKEMIKYKNNQIAPAEVEMVLLQHPGVKEACVLGKPSISDGDVPVAFVSRADDEAGAALTEDELKALVAQKLSDYKHLRGGVIFLDKLPKTVSGKVARRHLKDMLKAGTSWDLA